MRLRRRQSQGEQRTAQNAGGRRFQRNQNLLLFLPLTIPNDAINKSVS